jgi:hypothetical protein
MKAKDRKEFILLVKSMPCCICSAPPPSEFHHICVGTRLGDEFGLALCTNCHRGDDGFSGKNRGAWDKSLENQMALLAKQYKKLGRPMPEFKTKIGYLKKYENICTTH